MLDQLRTARLFVRSKIWSCTTVTNFWSFTYLSRFSVSIAFLVCRLESFRPGFAVIVRQYTLQIKKKNSPSHSCLSIAVSTSCLSYPDFIRLLFFHTHREASALAQELPEESDQSRFIRAACFANLSRPYPRLGFGFAWLSRPYPRLGFGSAWLSRPYPRLGFGSAWLSRPYPRLGVGSACFYSYRPLLLPIHPYPPTFSPLPPPSSPPP